MGILKIPRITTTNRTGLTLGLGELVYDTDLDEIYKGDGATSGGIAIASGTGDVVGPASAVNNHVVFFDNTTGKLIKDSGLTLSGTNTGDQTITLTGDVTGSGTGSFATTIGANKVTLGMMATLSAYSIIGNNTGSSATPLALTGTQVTSLLDTASATVNGVLSSTDWSTFNGKQAALSGTGIVKSTSGTISYLTDNSANWDTAYSDRLKWDGGATGLVASTGRTSLGLVIGTDVQAYDADLEAIATISGTSGLLKKTAVNTWSLDTNTYLTTNTLLTGLSGGQSVIGGTAASNNLTLSSTSNATKGKILFGTSGYDEANNRLGIGTASPSYPLHIVGGTLTDGQNVEFISATMPTTITATMNAINYQITSAGSSSFTNRAYNIDYLAGYTGSSQTNAFRVSNAVAGTGTAMVNGVANLGTSAATNGTTTGTNIGTYSNAANGNINIGVLGRAITNKNSATNIGVMGLGINTGTSPIEVGGFFGMQITDPTISTSAALMCDNGSEAVDIFVARDNGTKVWSIADGGNTTWGDAINMAFGTTTGTKIGTATSQKLAFWNKTPIVQPTTSLTVSLTFTANIGTVVNDASTFGGYTLKQIAQALINIGILA